MAESKSRLLHILKYLWQNTDAEHYATTADILAFLKGNGISCDRKTIPGDIAKLCDIGIDIEEERKRMEEEKKKVIAEIERASKMLSNPGFVNKAPEAKINEEKAKLEKYQNMLKNLEERLK